MDGTIIVADDDRTIRTVISQALTRAGCRVRATGTIATMWRWVEEGEGDVLVTDVAMPDGDALDLIPAITKRRPDLPILVMSAQNTVTTAIRAAEVGAFEYLPKPFDLAHLLSLVNKATKQSSRQRQAQFTPEPALTDPLPLIGRSPAMQEVYRIMSRLMNNDLSVMITGASGTGKGVVAKALHEFGNRKSAPFISINLAAIPMEQVEAELFGAADNPGKLDAAEGGSLFLDEVGDMPKEAQTRLLRVLQENRSRNIRIIASTQQNLRAAVIEGRFREDLFYRLNVVPISLPNLIERIDDIEDLAGHFLRKAGAEGQKTISANAIARLRRHNWRGNVRELKNLMQRLAVLSPDDIISEKIVDAELAQNASDPGDYGAQGSLSGAVEMHLKQYFSLHVGELPPDGLYLRILHEVEKPLINMALQATNGNQLQAAKLLGINRNTLRKKIAELDISVSRGKKMM